jgi:hypothetical protein
MVQWYFDEYQKKWYFDGTMEINSDQNIKISLVEMDKFRDFLC